MKKAIILSSNSNDQTDDNNNIDHNYNDNNDDNDEYIDDHNDEDNYDDNNNDEDNDGGNKLWLFVVRQTPSIFQFDTVWNQKENSFSRFWNIFIKVKKNL